MRLSFEVTRAHWKLLFMSAARRRGGSGAAALMLVGAWVAGCPLTLTVPARPCLAGRHRELAALRRARDATPRVQWTASARLLKAARLPLAEAH